MSPVVGTEYLAIQAKGCSKMNKKINPLRAESASQGREGPYKSPWCSVRSCWHCAPLADTRNHPHPPPTHTGLCWLPHVTSDFSSPVFISLPSLITCLLPQLKHCCLENYSVLSLDGSNSPPFFLLHAVRFSTVSCYSDGFIWKWFIPFSPRDYKLEGRDHALCGHCCNSGLQRA